MMIFFIGKNATLRSLAADINKSGHRVTFAPPHGALAALRGGAYDAVIIAPDILSVSCTTAVSKVRAATSLHTPIIIITASGSLETCRRCKAADDFTACIDLPTDHHKILSTIERLQSKRFGMRMGENNHHDYALTPREKDVLRMMRHGLSNREIASQLYITDKVVEKHIAHLCEKLNVKNRTEAVALSYRERVL